MKIRWLGQSAFLIEAAGKKIVIDPWIKNNPLCPLELEELFDVDIILVTHGHFDHFGDAIELMSNSRAGMMCDPEISWYMSKYGYVRGERLFPAAQGGTVDMYGVSVSMVPAIHPSAIYGDEWYGRREWLPNSSAVGFVITIDKEPVVYHAGDTALFGDMSLIAKRYCPEVAMLPIGGRFTMDVVDAEEAVGMLRAKYIVPMHYNTNSELVADAEKFKTDVERRYENVDVMLVSPGEELVLNREETV